MPAAISSRRAPSTSGPSCPKSAEEFVNSAAITICRSVVTAWAL
jgi:hypothetical protein